jgi:ABC-type spermidine/putrescine transport system permease subunit II
LLIPITAYAVALYVMFLEFGWLGSFWGLALAQAAGAVPLTILIAGAAYRRIPRDLEFAAMSLGASRARAALGITGRLLLPAFAAGFVFALLQSFDDAVYVSFLGGSSTRTLAREIFLSLREAVDPVITAISTLLMVFTALLVTLIGWLRNREVS